MTPLEREQRKTKWTTWILFLVVVPVSALMVVYAITLRVEKGVDPLAARVSALERAVADLQDDAATR